MPTLDFKGKAHVYGHHLVVPWRPLMPHPDRSVGAGDVDDNLIVHGDNLHALKALLPRYAGSVKCVCIDPPYNTGNEGWVYNDNGNSPALRHWLSENGPVDGEDLEPCQPTLDVSGVVQVPVLKRLEAGPTSQTFPDTALAEAAICTPRMCVSISSGNSARHRKPCV